MRRRSIAPGHFRVGQRVDTKQLDRGIVRILRILRAMRALRILRAMRILRILRAMRALRILRAMRAAGIVREAEVGSAGMTHASGCYVPARPLDQWSRTRMERSDGPSAPCLKWESSIGTIF